MSGDTEMDCELYGGAYDGLIVKLPNPPPVLRMLAPIQDEDARATMYEYKLVRVSESGTWADYECVGRVSLRKRGGRR